MTLTERIAARRCRVQGCQRERLTDAVVCRDCMNALYRNELDRQPDGSYVMRRTFVARDETGRWAA